MSVRGHRPSYRLTGLGVQAERNHGQGEMRRARRDSVRADRLTDVSR